ncbi:MAG: transposase [Candidatus Niyogibacteria bacterium]|nr:transposase [Candidatus Niyogibacteria bacterium]
MNRKIEFSIGEFYHLYNRGNNKGKIFLNDNDKVRFLNLLFLCNDTKSIVFRDIPKSAIYNKKRRANTLVDIGGYCLMPNHFHLLVHEKEENGISLFMQKLLTAYSLYFNKKHNRTGKLFEGVFGAAHADDDGYLKYLFAYIHLNPIKLIEPHWKETGIVDIARAEKFLHDYKYASYLDYIGDARPEATIINKDAFPEYFENQKEFRDHLKDWLNYLTT